MRICLLTNQDLLAVPFPAGDWPCDPRPYYPDADWQLECLRKATSVEQVERRIAEGFDVFFNLCDGAADQDTPGIEVVRTLEAHGAALIEEFIEGTECTVLVAENPDDPARPRTYSPIQYRFPPGETFKHSAMKWVDFDKMASLRVDDPTLDARLRDESARFFVALGGASFGRCDLRVDRAGTPFMLEINPNCGIYYPPDAPGSADLCLARDPEGHVGFTRQLIQAALQRRRQRT